MTLRDFVRSERRAQGMTQRELAAQAGLHVMTIKFVESRIYGGRFRPGTLGRVARGIGADIRRLVEIAELNGKLSER